MKKFIKYPVIFVITVIICLLLLVITSLIPKSAIEKSIEKSSVFLKDKDEVEVLKKHKEYTYLFYYSDCDLLEIIYCLDTSHPLRSSLEAKYYNKNKVDITDDLYMLVEENKEPNADYMRYWHGSMIIVRPLLVIFNIQQIYLFNAIVLFILIFLLIAILFKKSKLLTFAFLIGLVMIALPIVPNNLIYTWTILLMLVFSIILLKVEKKKPSWVNPIFLICGILTAYFDFLSTEILTMLVPLLILVTVRYKEGRLTNLKDGLKLIFLSMITWGIGYIGMFLAKWLIASIVLNINAIDHTKENVMLRVGLGYYGENTKKIRWQVITENVQTLFPIANYKKHTTEILAGISITFLILELLIVDPKKIRKMWLSVIMIIIGFIVPLLRFEVLLNHSYNHSFMVFRILLVTIMALVVIIANSFEARRKWIDGIINKMDIK